MKKLKILHTCEFYSPSIGGAQEVVMRISEELVRLGHDVTIATSLLSSRKERVLNGVKIREFDVTGNLASGMKGEIATYQRFLQESSFDIVLNYAAQQWTFDAALPVLEQIRGKKVFVPCGFSGLYLPEYSQYYKELPAYLKLYDQLVFLSENYRDFKYAMANNLNAFSFIPNGCSYAEFGPKATSQQIASLKKSLGIPAKDRIVLHVGSHTGFKGQREAIEIFNAANISRATLLLVGNVYSQESIKFCRKAQFKSFVLRHIRWRSNSIVNAVLPRAETVIAYNMADVFLFPSNIECSPIVLFEAMASGTPFISTNVGNASEIVGWSGAGTIMPTEITADGFSRAVIGSSAELLRNLIGDDEKMREQAENGRAAWRARFTWEAISKEYESLYFRLLEGLKK